MMPQIALIINQMVSAIDGAIKYQNAPSCGANPNRR